MQWNFRDEFSTALDVLPSQITHLYPQSPTVICVSNLGEVVSANWRSKISKRTSLFSKPYVCFHLPYFLLFIVALISLKTQQCPGITYSKRSNLLYVSMAFKSELAVIAMDPLGLSPIEVSKVSVPACFSCEWTKLYAYCNRFLLAVGLHFFALVDPISKCTVTFTDFQGTGEQILFCSISFSDISFVMEKNGERFQKLMTLRDMLLVELPMPDLNEFSFPETKDEEDENQSNEILAVEKQRTISVNLSEQVASEENTVDNNNCSDSDIDSGKELDQEEKLDLATCYPRVTEWIEPNRSPEKEQIAVGHYASDTNIIADGSLREQSHLSNPNLVPPTEETESRQTDSLDISSQRHSSPIRPAASADDRLMKLFFPADFSGEEAEDNVISSSLDDEQPHYTIENQMPPAVVDDEEEERVGLPEINFLEYWPIWLEMPLIWSYSVVANNPASAFFTSIRPTSIAISKFFIYVTDSTGRLSYASLDCKAVRWNVAPDANPASQVSCSPHGDIVWLLRGGNVFAAQSVKPSNPVGSRWERILLDVTYICVSEGRAFYIRRDGALMMQSGLSSRRPSYVSIPIHTPFRLRSVVVAGFDLWGQTADGRIAYNSRLLVHSKMASNIGEWQVDKQCPPDASNVTGIYSGPFNTVVVVDEYCRTWFRPTSASPSFSLADYLFPQCKSKDNWWLIPMPVNSDGSSLASSKVYPLLVGSCRDTVVLTAPSGTSGTLQLYLSKGHLLGQQMRRVRPKGSARTTKWKSAYFVEPGNIEVEDGTGAVAKHSRRCFAWLVSEMGELLRLDFANMNAISPSPSELRTGNVKHVSVGTDVSWVLLEDGNVWACHHGTGVDRWAELNLAQLGEEHLPIIDIAVGPRLVWILTATGSLFFRIGTSVFSSNTVSQPALCQLTDDIASSQDVPLRRIYASPSQDWMIFALPAYTGRNPKPLLRSSLPSVSKEDYENTPLARMGVTPDVPIGALWHPVVGGPPMADLCISAGVGLFGIPMISSDDGKNHTKGSTVYWRAGVKEHDPTGSYWRRVIDGIGQMSVGDSQGQLCFVGTDDAFYVHAVCCLANGLNANDEESPMQASMMLHPDDVDNDPNWEVI